MVLPNDRFETKETKIKTEQSLLNDNPLGVFTLKESYLWIFKTHEFLILVTIQNKKGGCIELTFHNFSLGLFLLLEEKAPC